MGFTYRKYPVEFPAKKNPLYRVWYDMRKRCDGTGHIERDNKNYHERGIRVCEEWAYWPTFAKWATENGYARGLELDRRDNNGGYSPENCRFTTKSENQRNTRASLKPMIRLETGDVFFSQAECVEITKVSRFSLRRALAEPNCTAFGWHFSYL